MGAGRSLSWREQKTVLREGSQEMAGLGPEDTEL